MGSLAIQRRVGGNVAEALVLSALAALGALAAVLHWPMVLRAPLGLALFTVVPGAVAARLLRTGPGMRVEDWVLLILTFSPAIVIVTRILSGVAGMSPALFPVLTALLSILAIWAVPVVPVREREVDRAVLLGAAALGVMVAFPALVDIKTRVFGDAIFHAQIVYEILLRGIPPQDPSYAGMPLTYMWSFHAWVASLVGSSGMPPFYVFPLVNGAMATALVLAARLGAEALGGERKVQRMAALVVPLGLNGLGWLTALGTTFLGSMVGRDHGLGVLVNGLRALFIHPAANNVSATLIYRAYFVLSTLLYKYFCANALATGLTFVAASWAWAATSLREARPGRCVALTVSVFGATAIHPMIGIPAMLGLFAGLVFAGLKAGGWRRILRTALGAGAGAVLALPLNHLMVGGALARGEMVRIHPVARNLISIPQVLLVVLPAAVWTWLHLRRADRVLADFSLGFVAVTLAFAVTIGFPLAGESYPIYVVYLGAALLAGAGFVRFLEAMRARDWAGPGRAIVAAVLLPTVLIQFNAFLRQGHADGLAGYPETPDERRVFEYLRDQTPDDVVIVDLAHFMSSAAAGFSGRRGLFGGLLQSDLVGYPHEEMHRRAAAISDLYLGRGALAADTRAVLAEDHHDVYVVGRRSLPVHASVAVPDSAHFNAVSRLDGLPDDFHPVVRTASLVLYRWTGQLSAGSSGDPPAPSAGPPPAATGRPEP